MASLRFRTRGAGRVCRGIAAASVVALSVAMLPSAVAAPQPTTSSARAVAPAEAASSGIVHATTGSTYEVYRHANPSMPEQWLACRSIGYQVNTAHMPAGLLTVIATTMSAIGRQTGVRFTYTGSSNRSFDSSSSSKVTPTIYFSFTSARSASGMIFSWPGTIGAGGPASAWRSSSSGTTEAITYGRVLLYSGFHGAKYGAGQTWQSLITHEVGHALNLAHRSSKTDAMYPSLLTSAPGRFSAAEVSAIRKVLRTSSCNYAAFAQL